MRPIIRVLALAVPLALALPLATAAAQAAAPAPLPAALRQFFAGRWQCSGAFASGRPIAADVTIADELEGHWLEVRHTDRAPNRYAAIALWGQPAGARGPVAVITDNFGGLRRFASDGWRDGTIVFVNDSVAAARPAAERFVYRRAAADTFNMRYERTRDGATWVLGDSLSCGRV